MNFVPCSPGWSFQIDFAPGLGQDSVQPALSFRAARSAAIPIKLHNHVDGSGTAMMLSTPRTAFTKGGPALGPPNSGSGLWKIRMVSTFIKAPDMLPRPPLARALGVTGNKTLIQSEFAGIIMASAESARLSGGRFGDAGKSSNRRRRCKSCGPKFRRSMAICVIPQGQIITLPLRLV